MNEKQITHAAVLAGTVAHREYFAHVAKLAHIRFNADSILVQRAMKSTDPYFNDIPLDIWDMAARQVSAHISAALKQCSDFYSLSHGVCTIKEAVRQAVERETARIVARASYLQSLHIAEGRPATDEDLHHLKDAADKWDAEHPKS